MIISNANNGPYFDALDVAAAQDGRWFDTPGDAVSLTASLKLALAGGGNVSGDLWVEFTADPTKTDYVKCVLPAGCLHTEFATVTLAAQKVVLASALTLTTLGLTLSFPVAGAMRLRWNPTGIGSIVAGANTIKMHLAIGRDS